MNRKTMVLYYFILFTVSIILVWQRPVMAEPTTVNSKVYLPEPLRTSVTKDGKSMPFGLPLRAFIADPNPQIPPRRIAPPAWLKNIPAKQATASFSITYVGSGGQDPWGEQCYSFPPAAKAAFNAAAGIWAKTLRSSVPISIRACWGDLGSSWTLGYSGGGPLRRDFAGATRANTWYAGSLANSLYGADLDSSSFDMHITYNRNFSWYYGTDGNTPGNQYDLMTVVLHEIGHGLNFSGSMQYANGLGRYGYGTGLPNIYDVFVKDGSGRSVTSYANTSNSLGSALTSNNLWFHGTMAQSANGSNRVKLYAPSTWQQGSSYSHLDYATFNNTSNQLMVYAISSGESIHSPGSVTKGLLQDLGWKAGGSASLPFLQLLLD